MRRETEHGSTNSMTLDTEGEELVDAREVAERLGLKNARTVLDLRVHRLGFPAPVGRQGRALLWSWSQVEMWGTTASEALPPSFGAKLTLR
jgi:predicted DNA-binding transcriptional regulator AlpA